MICHILTSFHTLAFGESILVGFYMLTSKLHSVKAAVCYALNACQIIHFKSSHVTELIYLLQGMLEGRSGPSLAVSVC
jgi:hypothetical protein